MPAEVGTSSSLRHFDPGLRFNFLIKNLNLPWNLGSGFVLRKNKEKKNERKKKKKEMARLSRIVVRGVFITGTETRTKKRGGREGGVVAPLSILNLDPLVISRPITTLVFARSSI